jgi:MFS family permease
VNATAASRDALRPFITVAMLTAAYTLSFVDRQVLSLLVEPIKADLGLSDLQISLLQGLAFSLFMGLGGLPLGWLADRVRRTGLIAAGITFWSLSTIGCGLSNGYLGLLLARMGVGVGEATLNPAAYSMLADAAPPRRLGLAVAVYGMGVYIGAGLALVLGALILHHLPQQTVHVPLLGALRPWQVVFVAVGLPGFLLALAMLFLREPPRREIVAAHASDAQTSTWRHLLRERHALGTLILCQAFAAMVSFTLNAWTPSYFIRSHHWTIAQTGLACGVTLSIAGLIGFLCCGLLGDWLVSRGIAGARLRVMGAAMLACAPLAAAFALAPDARLALLLLGLTTVLITMAIGSGPAALQEIVPNRMRGTTTAVAVLVVNLIGLGLGPTAVALLTDRVFGDAQALRLSLALATPCMALAAAALSMLSLRPYLHSQRKLHAPLVGASA